MAHMHLCLGTAVIAVRCRQLSSLAPDMLWILLLLLWQLVTYIDLCLVLADHCCEEEPAERFSLVRGTSPRLKFSKVPATAVCLAMSGLPPLRFLQRHGNTDVRLQWQALVQPIYSEWQWPQIHAQARPAIPRCSNGKD